MSPSLEMCFLTSDKWLLIISILHFSNPAVEQKKTLPGQTSGSRIHRSCWTWKTLLARRKRKVAEFLAPKRNQACSAPLYTRCYGRAQRSTGQVNARYCSQNERQGRGNGNCLYRLRRRWSGAFQRKSILNHAWRGCQGYRPMDSDNKHWRTDVFKRGWLIIFLTNNCPAPNNN